MGDAGLQVPTEATVNDNEWIDGIDERSSEQREINVLVTGFGPFKSFTRNPSWLIASSLPSKLILDVPSSPSANRTLTINLHVYPSQVPVSYAWVSSHIPSLLRPSSSASPPSLLNSALEPTTLPSPQIPYDHVLHIGMAGGRSFYSLETLAHRDGYRIKDVDGKDGYKNGEAIWRDPLFSPSGPAPEVIEFGYDELDVWERWTEDVTGGKSPYQQGENLYADSDANGDLDRPTIPLHHHPHGRPRSATAEGLDLRISHDPGRYLCDFIFYTSLAERYRQRSQITHPTPSPLPPTQPPTSLLQAQSRPDPSGTADGDDAGPRVIFLHVPGSTDDAAIATGRLVAEGLIRAVVGSWESGGRNRNAYGTGTGKGIIGDGRTRREREVRI